MELHHLSLSLSRGLHPDYPALSLSVNSYARELGILKEKDANFNGTDVRNGMTAVISIKHPDRSADWFSLFPLLFLSLPLFLHSQ